ncbi:T9SS type A sorting domain-containing protein [Membranihabitans marinus]|uniref:T9SS type A sorting domain-containing protein n=1 Tax=Membranihabitans marinus TaxID=1227546 RepID=UPI001F48A519|nr:T9SS type A sorting domain-containing protein [Membranihabitans marinus]
MKKHLLFTLLFLSAINTWAATYYSSGNKSWSDSGFPNTLNAGDQIIIQSGHTIALNKDIVINGHLTIGAAAKLAGNKKIDVGIGGIIVVSGELETSMDLTISGHLQNVGTTTINSKTKVIGTLDNSGILNSDDELHVDGQFTNSHFTYIKKLHSDGIILNTGTIELEPGETFHHHGGELKGNGSNLGSIIADELKIEDNTGVNLNNHPEAITSKMVFCGTNGQEPGFDGDGNNSSQKVSKEEFLTNGEPTLSIIDEEVFICANRTTPIELLSFQAEVMNESTVKIDWVTSSELNNDYFEIERSRDGLTWEKITQVNGSGTTQTTQYYTITDLQPYSGKTWYRLKQVDLDGSFSYSNTEEANINSNSYLSIYPNPSQDFITLSGSNIDLSQVRIFNGLGQDVSNLLNIGTGKTSRQVIDISTLPANIYYIMISNQMHKLIKQ